MVAVVAGQFRGAVHVVVHVHAVGAALDQRARAAARSGASRAARAAAAARHRVESRRGGNLSALVAADGWSCAARVALGALWVVLDLAWLDDLRKKHAFTETVYADKPWSERAQLVPDQDIAQAAERVRSYFASQPGPHRLLVGAESKYVFLKLIYDAAAARRRAVAADGGHRVAARRDASCCCTAIRRGTTTKSAPRSSTAADTVVGAAPDDVFSGSF